MESTITGRLEEVTGRTVNTRNGPSPIFDVTIGEKKVSTFKAGIAEEAKLLQGGTVEALVDVSERNGYTNYTLLNLKLVDAIGASQAREIPVAPLAVKQDYQRDMSPETAARVTRLACLSTAFQYAGACGFEEDKALSLAQRLYRVAMGKSDSEPVSVGAGVTGAPVAAEVSDDVPW